MPATHQLPMLAQVAEQEAAVDDGRALHEQCGVHLQVLV